MYYICKEYARRKRNEEKLSIISVQEFDINEHNQITETVNQYIQEITDKVAEYIKLEKIKYNELCYFDERNPDAQIVIEMIVAA